MPKSAFPPRRNYARRTGRAPFFDLPFVSHAGKGQHSNWHVPSMQDYAEACGLGREYAAHLLQYLKDNPDSVGSNLLGHIAKHIDFTDTSVAKGCWVGFFTHLERVLHHGASSIDVFADVDEVKAHYARLLRVHP